jgi:hypothetical protein
MMKVKNYNGRYEPDYQQWANNIIGEIFHPKETDKFIVYCLKEEHFGLVYDCAKYLTGGANHRRAQGPVQTGQGKPGTGDGKPRRFLQPFGRLERLKPCTGRPSL